MAFDEALFNAMNELAREYGLVRFFFSFFAETFIYVLIAVFVAVLFFRTSGRQRIYYSFLTALSVTLSYGLIAETIRSVYHRPRPFMVHDGVLLIDPLSIYSFPSGHMSFLVPFGMVMFFYNKKYGLWFLGLTFLVGIARIAVGVHWPTDIIGGILAGAVSFLAAHYILKKHYEVSSASR